MHVCVLGAGIAGLSTAYELTQAGHTVTVVDRSGAASGASGGNGSQLSYSYVQPLADPSIWAQLPKLLLSRSSPLKVKPKLDFGQWRWGVDFLLACNSSTSRDTTQRLLALAAASRLGFEEMLERELLDCDFSSTGKLVIFRSEESFAAARRQMDLQRQLGSAPQSAVGRDEAIAIEPALANMQEPMAGAIYTPSECAADCRKVCVGLEQVLRERGVTFLLGENITGMERRGDRLAAVKTDTQDITADAFVVALGAGSVRFAQWLGVRLAVYPLKGYSITLQVEAPSHAPLVSVTDSARKVVFARIGQRLRVAGMAELVGNDDSIPAGRIETLADATRAVFPGGVSYADVQPWTGMRPATPTGLPITGRKPGAPSNVVFNTGHGALGFTLAFGTARQVARALG